MAVETKRLYRWSGDEGKKGVCGEMVKVVRWWWSVGGGVKGNEGVGMKVTKWLR